MDYGTPKPNQEEESTSQDQQLMATSCKTCTKVISKGKARKTCAKCGWNYHVRCIQMHTILEGEGNISVCITCLTSINNPSMRTSKSAPPTRSTSPMPPPPNTTDTLTQILTKLNKLDNIDAMQTSMKEVENRMTAIESSLAPLKGLPALITRVEVVEVDVAALKLEQEEIKRKLESLLAIGAGSSTASTTKIANNEAIKKLQDSNEKLQASLRSVKDSVKKAQLKMSSEVVLSGLAHTETTSLKSLAYAALKLLDDEINECDIESARPMGRGRPAVETPEGEDEEDDDATVVSIAPLAVSLSSRRLMRSLIGAKIKRGKLHTSQLNRELLDKAHAPKPLPHSLININELLPSDIQHLKIAAWKAAKARGFSTFVRNGRVFIKLKKEAHAVRISSEEDLNRFLSTLKTPKE